MKLKRNTDLLNGLFQVALSKKPPTSTKKPHKKPLNTTLPQQSHNAHSSSSFSFLMSLSQLPASTEKQQVTGKTTDYVGKHWVLGQLQLSSLAGSALQIILHLLLITNIHRTAQGKEVFCYHFTTTRTHCRSAASGRNCSLANLNLPLLLFKVLTSAAAINRQDKA